MTYIVDDAYQATDSPEQYIAENGLEDGDTFALIRVEVISRVEYEVVDGKPVAVAIAFPTGGTER